MDQEINANIAKTGTTILAIMCKDGAVMGADRRVTAGNIVMSKTEQKVRKINDYLVLAWCGGAADAALSAKVIAAELRLKELQNKSRPSVKEAANMIGMMYYRNIRSPSMIPHVVGVLVGGFNEDGTVEAYTIEPAGGVYEVKDYDANFGSGMPFVLGLLERQWKQDLSIKEGVDLALESIKSSTQRDSASGNGIDIFSITREGIKQVVSHKITPNYN
jgi:proteasome beta subunit